jgi:GT2 family glycosyltransferase
VVPFAGPAEALTQTLDRLAALRLRPGDTVVVADNRRSGSAIPAAAHGIRVIAAGERRGSYFARNRGAREGSNPWLVFLDADVDPPPGLLDAYLEPPAGERTGILVGEVLDGPPAAGARAGAAVRYAQAFGLMSQARTLERGEWTYAQTANCAVRREAFEAAGGFEEGVRSGGDADLCFRLVAAGWGSERREAAAVVHASRATVAQLLRQRARVGAGARWLEDRYPGFSPRRPLGRALAGDARQVGRGVALVARGRREPGVLKALEGLTAAAFHVGSTLPNELGR